MAKKLTDEEKSLVKAEFDALFTDFFPEYKARIEDGTWKNEEFVDKTIRLMDLGRKIGIDLQKYTNERLNAE